MSESSVPADVRRFVIQRAANRCEYCRLSQLGQEATFHIDHVTPVSAGGESAAQNLALACVSCSLRKAARQTADDHETGEMVPLFSPRHDSWSAHFAWEGVTLIGITATGRATVVALAMNRPLMLSIRKEEAALGRHPEPESSAR